MNKPKLELRVLPEPHCLFRLEADAEIPPSVFQSPFFSITRSICGKELSIACEEKLVPTETAFCDRGWNVLQLVGTFPFSTVGILSRLSSVMARESIPLLAIATFDTDYLMIQKEYMPAAIAAFRFAGYPVSGNVPIDDTAGFQIAARAKPVLKWAGGKSGPLQQIVARFPTHFSKYYEPFLGGGAVFLSLRMEQPAVINDANPELFNLYQVIRDQLEPLCSELDRLQEKYSEAFYYALRSEIPSDPVRQAARTLFLNKTGFNGLFRLNAKGVFNVPFGKRVRCPALYERTNLEAVSLRLKNVELLNLDFEAVIDLAGSGDLVYCDPPYEPISRTSAFTRYTGTGFDQNEQRRLEATCRRAAERGVFVAISNSSAPFILDLYADVWNVGRIQARRAINSKGDQRGQIEEVLIRPSPEKFSRLETSGQL